MRPVNLIPPEKRRGDRAPLRTGALPYVLVGGLAVAVVLVTFVTLIGSKIADREAEVAGLEAQEAAASARAEALRPYAEFASLSVARDATVTSLAQSRFDWERVLRELARVIPEDVWLTDATGTANPSVQIQGAVVIDGRDAVAGPALELVGCGANQRAVAGFLAALRDIDGVTRVGIVSSERAAGASNLSSGSTGSADSDCRTRDAIARFQVVVAFDAVPVPVVPGATPPPATVPEASSTSTSTSTTSTGEQTDSGIAEVNAQQQQARDSAAEQTGEAQNAANALPAGVSR